MNKFNRAWKKNKNKMICKILLIKVIHNFLFLNLIFFKKDKISVETLLLPVMGQDGDGFDVDNDPAVTIECNGKMKVCLYFLTDNLLLFIKKKSLKIKKITKGHIYLHKNEIFFLKESFFHLLNLYTK